MSEGATLRARLTAVSLAGLAGAEMLWLLIGAQGFGLAGAACFLLFLIFGNDRLRLRERYLLALAVAAAGAAVWASPDPMPLLAEAATRASYLAAFMLLLSLLRDGAMTSTSVLEVGRYLTRQPPGRRYWAIAAGGHLMGVVMNFGALILLTPLVQRGARDQSAADPQEIVAIRERRQLSALARGFSWFIAWAPTSIAQLVAVAVVTGASSLRVALWGAVAAVLVLIAGWVEDAATGRRARRRLGARRAPGQPGAVPRRAFRRLGLVYLMLIAASAGIAWALGARLVDGIMLAAAPVTVLWIAMQRRAGRGDARPFRRRLRDLVMEALPDGSPEAATLALAGFTGTVLAAIVPPETTAAAFESLGGSPATIYAALPVVILLASTAAMPPMLTVTFLGAAASRASGLDLDPDLIALSLVLGWAINLCGSPFGATNLILARHTDVPGTQLAWAWNGVFTLSALGIAIGLLWGLSTLG